MKSILKGLRGEFKKVIWPSPKELMKKTITVLVVVAVCAIFIAGIDLLLKSGVVYLTEILK